jgi:spore maturation protein CgeB
VSEDLLDFDLVLRHAGGRSLEQLQSRLGARVVAPLYGSVDPKVHHPAQPDERYQADLSYLGYCPSGRLFEAEACGAAGLTDDWSGLDTFL